MVGRIYEMINKNGLFVCSHLLRKNDVPIIMRPTFVVEPFYYEQQFHKINAKEG